jgi:alpha-L-rhamnosidase
MLKPYPVKKLDYANVSYKSIYGTIVSNWEKDGNKFSWDFVIPYNTTGNVYFPVKGKMSQKDMTSIRDAGGTYVGKEDGFIEFTFPSGSYGITVDYPE